MRKLRSSSVYLFGILLGIALLALSAAAQTNAPNEWTWMGGSSTVNQPGVYGTLGTPAAGNTPGSRLYAVGWTDSSGNFWLFGGNGVDANGDSNSPNDLWEFNPATKEWAWMSGGSTIEGCFSVDDGYINCGPSLPGTPGTPASGNTPGGREWATSWTDSKGNLWLFGGSGFDPNGNYCELDDLWEFNPTTSEWAWMSGGTTTTSCENDSGGGVITWGYFGEFRRTRQSGGLRTYDTPASTASGNIPAGRYGSSNWTDSKGHLWLFGGWGISGDLNDLWEFDPSTNEWALMAGITTGDQPGVYGALGKSDAGNIPGSREYALSWTDTFGNFWLFGGSGLDGSGNGNIGYLGDLWEFSPSTNLWTWMGGNSTMNCVTTTAHGLVCYQPGEYGTLGVPEVENIPGGRYAALGWTDTQGYFWLFGGFLTDTKDQGILNDLWKYQPYANAATPIFSAAAGTYTSEQTVTISDDTTGATIYYTTDRTTPTTKSTVYSDPITIPATETLEAIAMAPEYTASPVATATYTIPPDFSLAVSPSSLTVESGLTGTETVTVTLLYGFNSIPVLSCSAGLPSNVLCNFSLGTGIAPGVYAFPLIVKAHSASAALHQNSSPWLPGSALALAFCCFGWKKRRCLPMLLLLAVSVAGLGLFIGCSGSSDAPQPVTSTVTVTATSGSLQHKSTFSLTVN